MRYLLAIAGIVLGLWLLHGAVFGMLLYTTQGEHCTRSLPMIQINAAHIQAMDFCVRAREVYRALYVELIAGVLMAGASAVWLVRLFLTALRARSR